LYNINSRQYANSKVTNRDYNELITTFAHHRATPTGLRVFWLSVTGQIMIAFTATTADGDTYRAKLIVC